MTKLYIQDKQEGIMPEVRIMVVIMETLIRILEEFILIMIEVFMYLAKLKNTFQKNMF